MNKRSLLLFGIGAILLIVAIATRGDIIPRVKNFWQNSGGAMLAEQVRKEIITPGALVFRGLVEESHLTSDGIFVLTNLEREREGLTPLLQDEKLNQIAQARLKDMFAKGYFEHEYPGGISASDFAEQYDYEYISIGENIALGNFRDDAALVLAWMESPGHRANIVSEKFTHLGVAVQRGVYNGEEVWMAAQIFGRPMSDCPTVDESAKSQIEADSSEIDRRSAELEKSREEIRDMERDRSVTEEEYQSAIEDYNKEVDSLNGLITEVKENIAKYNRGVRAFNLCLEQ